MCPFRFILFETEKRLLAGHKGDNTVLVAHVTGGCLP